MKFEIYNSITGKKEPFLPRDPKLVRIYSCGPTVYNFSHIGNIRSFLFVDVLRRSLKLLGYSLDQTMNITDIDDKIIKGSIEKSVTVEEFTQPWIEAFFQDIETIGIEKLEHYPRATESIPEMVEMIQRLKDKGLVYEKEGSVYYSIRNFPAYGKLSKIDVSGMKSGARYDTDEYEKEDVRDFVLWKSPKLEKEARYPSPFGEGRPGWHLECSAMIRKIYGSGVDIHTGGIDLLFPHHENEIAQSEGAYPGESFVKYWMHCEHLLVDGEKMSKSKGNFYTLRDLLQEGINPKVLRYYLLSVHYRSKLNFSLSRMEEFKSALERMQNCVFRLLENSSVEFDQLPPDNFASEYYAEFLGGISDDLNLPKALAALFDAVKEINARLDQDSLSPEEIQDCIRFFRKADEVLNVLEWERKTNESDAEIQSLIEQRNDAKKNKDFSRADLIRDQLTQMGIVIEDSKDGTRWRRK